MGQNYIDINKSTQRIIGRYGNGTEGPTIIAIGGMHGNEPTGVKALQNVLQVLEENKIPLRGEFIALCGNLEALQRKQRFIDNDLNRLWTSQIISWIREHPEALDECAEHKDQLEILEIVESILEEKEGPFLFLDLHTTSADGPPFSIIEDSLYSRSLASRYKVPVILGILEQLEGTFLNYVNEMGYTGIGFEGGQHDLQNSVENHVAILWITMLYAGGLPLHANYPFLKVAEKRMKALGQRLPSFLEIRYRHEINNGDEFFMKPGYLNFQSVMRNELLANDRNGPIRAIQQGRVLLPLYQGAGDDGFFLAREVKSFWMRIAACIRLFKIERILPWLPGIYKYPKMENTLVVNTDIARWFAVEIFHLLGFRKVKTQGKTLIFSKIKHDISC